MEKHIRQIISTISIISLLAVCTLFTGCDISDSPASGKTSGKDFHSNSSQAAEQTTSHDSSVSADSPVTAGGTISLKDVPEWDGEPSVIINDNDPGFTSRQLNEINDLHEDQLSKLDSLGRCGEAMTCIGRETMPEGKRGSIGMIRPSGWQLEKYDFVDGKYLYNRCHLIGWQLTGLNAEEKNLITGTRYLNTEGMLPYENEIASYVKTSGNHVAYRVEPVFKGDELLARGVHMQAESIEDKGKGLSFNVYCYNVQPDVSIDYMTGESEPAETQASNSGSSSASEGTSTSDMSEESGENNESTYILNTNTKRYHLPGCRSLSQMKDKNKQSFHGTKKQLKEKGYSPCGNCRP